MPEDNKPKKGKSFSKETEKLDTKRKKSKKSQAQDQLAQNHSNFRGMVHRRFTFGLKNKHKIIANTPKENTPDHRYTFTKNMPSLLGFMHGGNSKKSTGSKNYMEGKL